MSSRATCDWIPGVTESAAPAAPSQVGQRPLRWVAVPLVVFAVVSLTAGLLAAHDPRSKGYFRLFFSDPIHLKAGFATAAAALACFQLLTAAWIFRKLPWHKPAWVNPAHRWSGRLAFLCTLPVAFHCIFILGFRSTDARVLANCVMGSFVYGVFAVKIFFVRDRAPPRWTLPVLGGTLFAVLVTLWSTSAYWYFTNVHFGL